MNDKVLLLSTSLFSEDVRQTLLTTGAFSQVDIWDGATVMPVAADLVPYGAVLAFGERPLADPGRTGDALADYVDRGGTAVLAPFFNATQTLGGRFGDVKNGYLLIQPGEQEAPLDQLGRIREPGSPLIAGVFRLRAERAFRSSGNVLNGGSVVAEWALGRPMVVRGSVRGHRLVALNVFPPSGDARSDFASGDIGQLLRNALLFR